MLDFKVSLFGISIYSYLYEVDLKIKMINLFHLQFLLQNDKKKFVDLIYDSEKDKFNIKGSSYNGVASTDNVIGNWWNHKVLQANSQISPISGSIKEQVVTFIAKEKIDLYGKTYEVDHFKLTSKDMTLPKDKRLNFDIWFDKENSLILKVTYSRLGNWEYKVKKFE